MNEQYHINDINDVLSGFADGLENTGKTRISNKFKLYTEKNNGYVFYGNQYVKTIFLAENREKAYTCNKYSRWSVRWI